MNDLSKLLPNNLSIVGNAESLLASSYGSLIDQYPTIRFNRTQIINSKAQGKRWDYLASSEVNTFEMYNKMPPPFHSLIFSPTKPEMIHKVKKVSFKCDILYLPLQQSLDLQRTIGNVPSTGLQILCYLDSINHRYVHIFGFDFKKTKTFYEIRNKGAHDWIKEELLIKGLIKKNSWNFYG